jgi:phosphatidylinositol alpha-mannosyltransferase
MASETPVVASDLEAFSLVLESGRCGELFPNGDASALADSVIRVLEDRDYAATLVAEGTRRAARFDWRTVAREVLEVYDAVRQPGVIVTEDLRGQLVGRLAGFGRGGRE